ncbi:hypothetical protein ACH5RR_003050 [Cinchona calisaya]|uniref:Uncharacterized protein n=1 Tax=Cinchona calisaya TaxID=153742 RepID=A0ABD3AUA8_9GENT
MASGDKKVKQIYQKKAELLSSHIVQPNKQVIEEVSNEALASSSKDLDYGEVHEVRVSKDSTQKDNMEVRIPEAENQEVSKSILNLKSRTVEIVEDSVDTNNLHAKVV